MLKLCINSRDELFVLDLDKVAYIQASGNYSRIVYIGGMPFVRLGRSLLVNQTYLTHINVLKQRLTLSDNQEHSYVLDVPKALLKAYKDLIRKSFAERIKNKEE